MSSSLSHDWPSASRAENGYVVSLTLLAALTLKTPSELMKRGSLARSMPFWSNTVVVFRIPSVEADTKSNMPTAGFVNSLLVSIELGQTLEPTRQHPGRHL